MLVEKEKENERAVSKRSSRVKKGIKKKQDCMIEDEDELRNIQP